MKKFFIFVFLTINTTNVVCQNTDSVIVSSGNPAIIYPLTSDKNIEERKNAGIDCHFTYPLLILNGLIIREKEKVDCFRNQFKFTNIKSSKRITKAEAEKKGIPDVPKDGVLFVTIKKGYYFDLSCNR